MQEGRATNWYETQRTGTISHHSKPHTPLSPQVTRAFEDFFNLGSGEVSMRQVSALDWQSPMLCRSFQAQEQCCFTGWVVWRVVCPIMSKTCRVQLNWCASRHRTSRGRCLGGRCSRGGGSRPVRRSVHAHYEPYAALSTAGTGVRHRSLRCPPLLFIPRRLSSADRVLRLCQIRASPQVSFALGTSLRC